MLTIVAHLLFHSIFGPTDFVAGTKFDTYEEFVAYMETPLTYDGRIDENSSMNVEELEEIYYDENGNEISREDCLDNCLCNRGRYWAIFLQKSETIVINDEAVALSKQTTRYRFHI